MNVINLWFAEDHDTDIPTILPQKPCQLQEPASGIYVIFFPDDRIAVHPTEAISGILIPPLGTPSGI
ncbi:MAG: hypothetical protein WC346_18665 [Methanogenium sp.]|jgi:hypothetical protein